MGDAMVEGGTDPRAGGEEPFDEGKASLGQ